MPEPVMKTVVAASPDRPCPRRRTSVSPSPGGRDSSLIYADTPVEVPVKFHPHARYYRRRLAKGDLIEVSKPPPKSEPAPLPEPSAATSTKRRAKSEKE